MHLIFLLTLLDKNNDLLKSLEQFRIASKEFSLSICPLYPHWFDLVFGLVSQIAARKYLQAHSIECRMIPGE